MAFLFGSRKQSSADILQEYKRSVGRSVRECEREQSRVQSRERQLKAEIQKAAREGDVPLLRNAARELVGTRRQARSLSAAQFKMRTLGSKVQSIKTTQNLTEVLSKTTRSMNALNSSFSVKDMAKVLHNFEHRGMHTVDSSLEMVDETLDETLVGGVEEEEEVDTVMGEVMAEMRIDLSDVLQKVPRPAPLAKPSAAEIDLDVRLQRLREPPPS